MSMVPIEIRKVLFLRVQKQVEEDTCRNKSTVSKMLESELLSSEAVKLSVCETYVEYAMQ